MNKGKIIVAGIGPGSEADITPAVLAAIQSSDVIIGYKYYFRFITHLLREGTECIDTGMNVSKLVPSKLSLMPTREDGLRDQFR